MGRRGRRRGPNSTREGVLDAARRRFAEAGYDAASIRSIAAEAGVDPGVVVHFFGSKDELFRTAVGWPFDPAVFATLVADAQPEGLAGRLVEVFFRFWDDPATRAPLTAILRSAMQHEPSRVLLREFVVHRLMAQIDGLQVGLRTNLAAAQLIGVAVLRYILQVEPIASASTEEIVAWVTPVISYYLDQDRTDGGPVRPAPDPSPLNVPARAGEDMGGSGAA